MDSSATARSEFAIRLYDKLAGTHADKNLFFSPFSIRLALGGHIEIGDQAGFGFVAMAQDYGGVIYEDDLPCTLSEAMVALKKGLRKWFEEEGIEIK